MKLLKKVFFFVLFCVSLYFVIGYLALLAQPIKNTQSQVTIMIIIVIVAFVILGWSVYHIVRPIRLNKERLSYYNRNVSLTNKVIEVQENESANKSILLEKTINCIKEFKPQWAERNGKKRLEGGENGNNAMLAQFLRDNGINNVETELGLINRGRSDLLINNEIAIECKPHLLTIDKLDSLSKKIKRVKRMNFKTYAVIYGDAREDFLKELYEDIENSNVIILGSLVNHV